MIKEKTVKLLDKDVAVRYCAASEQGFEQIRKKSIYEIDFNLREDLIALCIASIIAAYARKKEEPPITSDDVIYELTSEEFQTLAMAVVELRGEWYQKPEVIKDEPKEDDGPKN